MRRASLVPRLRGGGGEIVRAEEGRGERGRGQGRRMRWCGLLGCQASAPCEGRQTGARARRRCAPRSELLWIKAVARERLDVALGHLSDGEVGLEGDAVADARDLPRPVARQHRDQRVEREVVEDGASEHGDLPLRHHVLAAEQPQQRRLARAVGADEQAEAAARQREGEVGQSRAGGARVAPREVLHLDAGRGAGRDGRDARRRHRLQHREEVGALLPQEPLHCTEELAPAVDALGDGHRHQVACAVRGARACE